MGGLTSEQTTTQPVHTGSAPSRIASVSRGVANRLNARQAKMTENNQFVSGGTST